MVAGQLMRCPRCDQAPVTWMLLLLGDVPAEAHTPFVQVHRLCAACREDVFWFVAHRTLKRVELVSLKAFERVHLGLPEAPHAA